MRADPAPRTRHHDRIKAEIEAAGYSTAVAQALLALDAEHFHYVRRVMKGDIPQSLMEELDAGVEATHFHALSAIMRIQNGYGRPAPQEVTVGLLAEELNLDPSRASRIAADLVERGLVERAVSQEDGRRSVLQPTAAAGALLEAFLMAKWQRTMKLFASWSEADIVAFATLFGRYSEGMRQQYPGRV
jgi:DNA-binding MarR family transcriptional regulator